MNISLITRWVLIVLMLVVCSGCSLDPNRVNKDTNEVTFTMCGIPAGQDRLYGVRYIYGIPDIFFKPHCNYSRLQYYKREDDAWIRSSSGTELRIEGNLEGSSDHYNMNINQLYQLFQFGLPERKKFLNENRGERYSYSLDKVIKNDMHCIRLETLLRGYDIRPKPNQGNFDNRPSRNILSQIPRVSAQELEERSQNIISQGAKKNIEYYCWAPNDNINNYVKISAQALSSLDIPDEKYERYHAHIKRTSRITEEEDEYANAPVVFKVDLEKEVLDPVFATLKIRPVSEEIKKKSDTQWKAACEAKSKKEEPMSLYRRLYLENCGYTVN